MKPITPITSAVAAPSFRHPELESSMQATAPATSATNDPASPSVKIQPVSPHRPWTAWPTPNPTNSEPTTPAACWTGEISPSSISSRSSRVSGGPGRYPYGGGGPDGGPYGDGA